MRPVVDLFKQAYPRVEVVLHSGKNNELAAQILEERSHPAADLLLITDALPFQTLKAEGALAPYLSERVRAVPAAFRDPEGAWSGVTLRARVIMYNTDLVKPEEAPTSIFDLTDPQWKGQLAMAGSGDGGQAMLAGLTVLKGPAAAEAWLRGIVDNGVTFFPSHTEVRKAVAAGEFKLGLVNHYYYYLQKAEGSPVGVVWPDQGPGQVGLFVHPTAIAVIQGGQNPQAARAFVDFLLSVDAQNVFANLNYEYPVVAGVPLNPDVEPLTKQRLADVPLSRAFEVLPDVQTLIQQVGMPP